MLFWPCFLFTGLKEMVVLIFIQNRSAGNQASSDGFGLYIFYT